MPALSPTMEEGKIVSWNKKEGDKVALGDVLLEVETDKAVMEVEAQDAGVVGKILYKVDDIVKVNKTIALMLEKGETADAIKDYKIQDDEPKAEEKTADVKEKKEEKVEIKQEEKTEQVAEQKPVKNIVSRNNDRVFASPLAKSIASMNNISLSQIGVGSGPNGRIIKADVEMFLANPRVGGVFRNPVEYTDINPTGMRATIAKRLTQSKQDIPHWYLKITPDMTNFVNFRTELNKMAKVIDGKPEYKISANDIIVLAIAKALKRNPSINASWIDGKIRQYNNVDVSVAVSIDGGLITPVVKNADQKGLLEISKEIKQLASKAKEGKLTPDEYSGGSISISNLGMYGVSEFYSIINPPQSCIVAVGAIENKPVELPNGKCQAKPVCNLVFSADHRVIDGSVLAPFANDVKTFLENPGLMFVII